MIKPLTVRNRSALARVLKNPPLLPVFVKKIDGLQWFDAFIQEGLLSPEKVPQPIKISEDGSYRIPSWPIAEYLVSSSKYLSDIQYVEYAVKYLDLIRSVTNYSSDNYFSNYRVWWQFSKILKNIPIDLIEVDDVNFISYWLQDEFESGLVLGEIQDWLLTLSERSDEKSKNLTVKLLDDIYTCSYRDIEFGSSIKKEAFFNYRDYSFDKFIDKTSFALGASFGAEVVTLLEDRLQDILNHQGDDELSTIWRPAIEEHSQNTDLGKANVQALRAYRDALLGYVNASRECAIDYVKDVLNCNSIVIKRIAIHVIDKTFEDKSENLVFDLMESSYFGFQYQHEMWNLLSNNFTKFSEALKTSVLTLIEDVAINDTDTEKAIAFKKQTWLSSIKDQSGIARYKYNEALLITNYESSHPDFSSYMTVSSYKPKSELSVSDMNKLSLDSLIKELNNYEEPEKRFESPSLDGLVKEFRQFVKSKPSAIVNSLCEFRKIRVVFQYEIIEAYSELWKEDQVDLSWGNVWPALFDFCFDLISEDSFWAQEVDESISLVANKHWVVGAIGRLIELGSKSDERSFDFSCIDKALSILVVLLEKQESEVFEESSDFVTVSINSPKGKCIEALINLSLFKCRNSKHFSLTIENVWNEFKPVFETELSKVKLCNYEITTLISNYIPNFFYMSDKWTLEHLDVIFDHNNRLAWLSAVQGYSYVGHFSQEMYDYLKNSGCFSSILDDQSVNGSVKNRYIHNITTFYLLGRDGLDNENGLMNLILNRFVFDEISSIIRFSWSFRERGESIEGLNDRVMELWFTLRDRIDVNSSDGKKLASKVCRWSAFVSSLEGDSFDLLMYFSPYAEIEYNSADLLLNLARLSHNYPLQVSKIWISMLTNPLDDYSEDAIKIILRSLLKSGNTGAKRADRIVSLYLKHGYQRPIEWLREVQLSRGRNRS